MPSVQDNGCTVCTGDSIDDCTEATCADGYHDFDNVTGTCRACTNQTGCATHDTTRPCVGVGDNNDKYYCSDPSTGYHEIDEIGGVVSPNICVVHPIHTVQSTAGTVVSTANRNNIPLCTGPFRQPNCNFGVNGNPELCRGYSHGGWISPGGNATANNAAYQCIWTGTSCDSFISVNPIAGYNDREYRVCKMPGYQDSGFDYTAGAGSDNDLSAPNFSLDDYTCAAGYHRENAALPVASACDSHNWNIKLGNCKLNTCSLYSNISGYNTNLFVPKYAVFQFNVSDGVFGEDDHRSGQLYSPFDGYYEIDEDCDGSTGSIRYNGPNYSLIYNEDPETTYTNTGLYDASRVPDGKIKRWLITTNEGCPG